MTTEVYELEAVGGYVRRRLVELGMAPEDLYFGTLVADAAVEEEGSTTSTTYLNRLTEATPVLAAGDRYVLFWYMEFRANLQNKNAAVRVQVDDTTTITEVEREGNEWFPVTGFGIYNVTSEKSYTVDIDYRAIDGTAYIRRARLIGWKVGTV